MSLLHLAGGLDRLLQHDGYWAVMLLVFLESTGLPTPGETILITAAAYAGATHQLSPVLIVLAAAVAGILGDNMGYWIGREGGWRLLRRYGRFIRVDDGVLKIGVYLFARHGGKVVFFGRFTPIIRTYGALLAGVNRFRWPRFVAWNAASAFAWAASWGSAAYLMGHALTNVEGYVSLAAVAFAAVVSVVVAVVLARQRRALRAAAERAYPGGLDELERRPRAA